MKNMSRTERILWSTAISVIICLWVLTVTNLLKFSKADDNTYKNIRIFNTILSIVGSDYVDKPDNEKLIYGAIDGMLATLDDPYTRFLRKEGYTDLKTETEGKFGGCGFVITKKNGWLTIIAPLADTPASRAGLMPNDRIIKINDESTKEMELNTAVSKLKGDPGTDVVIWIVRDENKEPIKFTLKREIIKIESVFSKIFNYDNKKIGYLKIKTFGEDTYDHLVDILKDYENQKLDGLIMDLRNNPGGLLLSAYKISDLFLSKGIIVSTKGRIESQNQVYYADSVEYCAGVPMVILANDGSASGSEIVIGALKDNKRAIVVGTKTFGKGVVQTVRDLGDGIALAITTARYYTPSGVCIHKIGIEPNIKIDFPKTSDKDINDAEAILKKEYLEDFVKNNKNYLSLDKAEQEKRLNELIKKLNSDKINADYNLVRKLVKSKFYEIYHLNDAIIDLDDDIQLKKGADVLAGKVKM